MKKQLFLTLFLTISILSTPAISASEPKKDVVKKIETSKDKSLSGTNQHRTCHISFTEVSKVNLIKQELGERIGVSEVAELLGIDKKTVRENYDQLGGMRLGRLYLFFERSVINAIQKETEMDSPSAEGWEETGESISGEEGGSGVGSQDAPKTRQRMEQEDLHGLFE